MNGRYPKASNKDNKDDGVEIVDVPIESRIPGERVYFEGAEFEGALGAHPTKVCVLSSGSGKEPLPQLNPKKKIFETIQPGELVLGQVSSK